MIPKQLRFLLQIVIPLIVAGVGVLSAGAGVRGMARDGPNLARLMIVLLGAVLIGAAAFPHLIRKRHLRQSDATFMFLGAGCAAILALGAFLQFAANPPPKAVSSDLVSVTERHYRRHARLVLHFAGDPQGYEWTCGRPNCADAAAIRELRALTPLPAEAQVEGSELVGLSVNGRLYIDPARVTPIVRRNQLEAGLLLLGLAAVGIFFGCRRMLSREVDAPG